MRRVLFAVLAIFFYFQTSFQRLFIFSAEIIRPLALRALKLDEIVSFF